MLTYHQCGHNFVWNLESIQEDDIGEGLILSPVNLEAERIRDRIPEELLATSWMDPQFYVPDDSKGKLETYPFFPANVLDDFTTSEFVDHAREVARECLSFQHELGLRSLVIPTRYYEDLPEDHIEQLEALFLEPFLESKAALALSEPLLLTVIAKPIHLEPGIMREELLTWVTSEPAVSGIYLIFDHNFISKQIKDPEYLVQAMRFIRVLRLNGMEVHIGYSGLEGLLYSIADPTSVSIGSYENLRSFGTRRLESRDTGPQRAPRPRVYSGRLLQWIEDTYLPPLRELVPNWRDLFDDSPYKEYLLNPDTALNFQRSEIYKHYFFLFAEQIADLPTIDERAQHIRSLATRAIDKFERIGDAGVYLDSDSDQSHLPAWLNAVTMYQNRPE